MQEYPTRWTYSEEEKAEADHKKAIRFLLQVINSTIYASCEDYDQAVQDFFVQIEALGHLVGAADLDEVSAYLRRRCRPL